MPTVRRSLILLVALALLAVPMAGPAAAYTTEDVHVIATLDPTSIQPGETTIRGSIVDVRGIVLQYGATDLLGTWPIEDIRLTVNYRIDLDTGRGVIWGTSESVDPEGYRGYHVGRVFDAVATGDPHVPIAFSFTNRQVTYGNGTVIVVTGSSSDSGFSTELVGRIRTFG